MKKNAPWLALLLIAVLTCAVYGMGLGNALVFDDQRLGDGTIYGRYGSLLEFKPRLLSYGSFVWLQALAPDSLALQRLFNLALHLGTVAGLYALFSRLLALLPRASDEDTHTSDGRQIGLIIGCAWFALSPAAVYGVGYLVQRPIVMATFFAAWACYAGVRGLQDKSTAWLGLSLALYVAAVLSKEQSFLLAALGLPLYVFVRRPDRRTTLTVLLACGVIALLAVAALFAFYPNLRDMIGQMFDDTSRQLAAQLDRQHPGAAAHIYALSVLNQAALFFYYGLLWVLPVVGWMSIDMRPPFPLSLASWPHLLGALGYLALLLGAAWAVLRRSDAWGFLGLCLLFPLLLFWTEFATVWVQDPMVLYRSYLWAMPLPGLLAWGLGASGLSRRVLYGLGIAAALVLAALSFERLTSFKTPMSVWTDAVEKTDLKAPANAVGRYRAYLNRGAQYLDRFSADLALSDFRTAHSLGEPSGTALFNQGVALQVLKKHTEALQALGQAEAAGFRDGTLHYHQAESHAALGQWGEAAQAYERALQGPLAPAVARQSRVRHAEAAMRLGQYEAAVRDYEQLLAQEPGNARHLAGLGLARIAQHEGAAALKAFDQALTQPQEARQTALGHYGRALALALLGQADPAREAIAQAVQLDPQNPVYRQLQQQWVRDVRLPALRP